MHFLESEELTTDLIVDEEEYIYCAAEPIALQQVTANVPDRYLQQTPSSTGKVVYVIFNGREPGLWYNWYILSLLNFNSAYRPHLGML